MDISRTETVTNWFQWFHDYSVEDGVTVGTLAAEKNGLEYNRRSIFYFGILWLVSLWAMASNMAQALFVKILKKRNKRLSNIIWEIGRDPKHISSFAFDRFSRFNHQVKFGAAGWRSLDLFYNYNEKVKPQLNGNLEGWLTQFWMGKMQNRQAVTNRLEIVVQLLTQAFSRFVNEPEVRLVSVASGSAQAVVEAMLQSSKNIKVVLIDVDPTGMEKAKEVAKEAGLENRFCFVRGSTKKLEKICSEFKPHIIEMVGFLDYRPRDKAIELIGRIKKCLPDDGILLTCNIRRNIEKIFLDWVLLWPMHYRSEKQLAELLIKGGFFKNQIDIIYDPFKIHGVAVCQKGEKP